MHKLKCMFTLYFKPSEVAFVSWVMWGSPNWVWSAPSSMVCIQSLSCAQWLQRYMYIPLSKRTYQNTYKCTTTLNLSVELNWKVNGTCSATYIFPMDCFRFLPCSSFVRIVPCLANIIFYEYALITHRKPTQKKRRKQHNNDKVLENGTCSVGALTITNLRKAQHLRWGNVSSHTRLNCLAETLIRSVFPFSNSSSYHPFTSPFLPAGMWTSSISGWTPP